MPYYFPFGQELVPLRQEDKSSKKVFVLCVYASAVHARWKKDGKKIIAPNLSYDYDCEVTAHNFRHHYITAKVESGERPEVIMAIVGHKDYTTTINVYTHINNRIGETEPTRLSKLFTESMGSEVI